MCGTTRTRSSSSLSTFCSTPLTARGSPKPGLRPGQPHHGAAHPRCHKLAAASEVGQVRAEPRAVNRAQELVHAPVLEYRADLASRRRTAHDVAAPSLSRL